MPDKKLTDNEIIKALECCNSEYYECPHCPLLHKGCKKTLLQNALDLINRQKAELKRFTNRCLKCAKKTTKTTLYLQELLAEKNAEIEQLKTNPTVVVRQSNAENNINIAQIKAEAYKECIEKINKNLNSRASFGSMAESVICESIINDNDNLLKELVGDTDDKH